MTITLEIRPELQAELARQAAARGSAIETYVAKLLEEAVVPRRHRSPPPAMDLADAIEQLKTFGRTHGLSLDGMTIRELRHEARP